MSRSDDLGTPRYVFSATRTNVLHAMAESNRNRLQALELVLGSFEMMRGWTEHPTPHTSTESVG